MKHNFYVTTPIYYVNDSPHIGHAYTNVIADVLARFNRLDGNNVRFLTGTDEHGQKIEKSALQLSIDPQEFVDTISERFRTLCTDLNISNDDFIRTTESRHKKAVLTLWNQLLEKGHIYKDKYCGWYSIRDEAFFSESEITEDKKAPTGAPVEWVEEESYFFNLSKWQDKLVEFYTNHPDTIYPRSRLNEVMSFIKSGLIDLSISRTTIKWGISVPEEKNHIIYVWLDALTNYISALGYPDDNKLMEQFWLEAHHVIGKDILRFHAVYWPAFLMAVDLPLPKKIIAHGWWVKEGQKISKSIGNVIVPSEMIHKFGLDQFRYFLLREVTLGNDGDFSEQQLIKRINSELSNNIGNLFQRTLSMIYKNCNAVVPTADLDDYNGVSLLKYAVETYSKVTKSMSIPEPCSAIAHIIDLATQANIYIDEQAPWALKNSDPEKMKEVLYIVAETCRYIAILLQPFIPNSASKMLDILNIDDMERNFSNLNADFRLKSGNNINKPEAVFPRIEDIKE